MVVGAIDQPAGIAAGRHDVHAVDAGNAVEDPCGAYIVAIANVAPVIFVDGSASLGRRANKPHKCTAFPVVYGV